MQLLPLLITSLDCPDEALQLSTMDGIYALIFDAPDVMATYIPTVIPKLLHLAQQAVTMVMMKYVHRKYLAGEKLANELFAKIFLTNSFYLYGLPKFSLPNISCVQ